MVRQFNVPWLTKDGHIDFKKIPMDSLLKQAIRKDDTEFRGACSFLRMMHMEGIEEAGICLYGLFAHNSRNMKRKEIVIHFLGDIETRESADIMFKELRDIESNNITRGYIDEILKGLSKLPIEYIEEGFQSLLNDKKWSIKMKRKFEDILFHKKFSTV